ncbi:tetratricopeptide repeat protein [Candidatus Pelagibacter sp.]|nr:tetratricopeptide repeat protein [Candidatus Pelagibacter sp.]
MRVLILVILFLNLSYSTSFAEKKILNSLFDQLRDVTHPKTAELLERMIWDIWNEHPNNMELTQKLELGTELMQYGDYNYALKVFNNVIDSDPEWSEAWNKRATVYFLMSQFTESLSDIDRVLSIEPRHFGALSGQARIYINLKKYEKAIKSIEEALKFYPAFKNQKLIPEIQRLINEESI